jgi:hypothetical protein
MPKPACVPSIVIWRGQPCATHFAQLARLSVSLSHKHIFVELSQFRHPWQAQHRNDGRCVMAGHSGTVSKNHRRYNCNTLTRFLYCTKEIVRRSKAQRPQRTSARVRVACRWAILDELRAVRTAICIYRFDKPSACLVEKRGALPVRAVSTDCKCSEASTRVLKACNTHTCVSSIIHLDSSRPMSRCFGRALRSTLPEFLRREAVHIC